MFGYSIQSSQIDFRSVRCLFTYKLLKFPTFCFQLIVQLLPFSFVRFLTNNSFHIFEASWARVNIDTLFYWLKLSSVNLIVIAGKTNSFPRLQVISKFLGFIPLSSKMVFAFEWSVKDKRKCVQGPPSKSYSCWICRWQNINNTSFYEIIYCVYPGLLLQLFHAFDIIMHGWQCNFILLTTSFTRVGKKHEFLFGSINIHDRFFLPIKN